MPVVSEITPEEADGVPGLQAVVEHWAEGAPRAGEWVAEVGVVWGSPGLVMRRGEEVLGFAVYGPPELLPRVRRYRVGALGEDAAVLAYVGGDRRTRKHLLVRVMREMKLRGFGGVEAIGDDLGLRRSVVIPTRFLVESGWKPVRRGFALPSGLPCTLLRADLGSTVEVAELARGLVDLVRLPVLKSPVPSLRSADSSPVLAPPRTAQSRASSRRPPGAGHAPQQGAGAG
jgi:hypothetical protein